MVSLECPCLRPGLEPIQDENDPARIYIFDRLRLTPEPQCFSLREFEWIQLFDGQRTLRDVQAEAIRQAGGELLVLDLFTSLMRRLDNALLLDGPSYRRRLADPIREPSCIGCYEAEPEALRNQLRRLFSHPRGPGLPEAPQGQGRLRAALIPHIDYSRGGVSFAWGFKELFEQCGSALFVIVGTSHYSTQRFTLTRKDFRTPLGITSTDQQYIDRLVKHYGDGLFDDEMAHLPEHSIELEVVFLQYLYENRRPIRIVPLVVGSFQDAVNNGTPPRLMPDIGRMIAALRQVEAETKEPICYIISGDLAHIGPKFGDLKPVGQPWLKSSRKQDLAILKHAEAADARGYFHTIAAECDSRRICGLPPTYTVLEALQPTQGRLLHYDQYLHPAGFESVSFASVAFYKSY